MSVKPETLLLALGVVAEAEKDAHLAKRLQRLARKVSRHMDGCPNCHREATYLCLAGLELVSALSHAAASGQRNGVEDRL